MAIGINFGDDDDFDDEGSMFGPKMGTWWVSSRLDPRWSKDGRSVGMALGGTQQMHVWLEHCDQAYGKRPSDLTMGFMKD